MKIIQTESAPAAIGPYSQAVVAGNMAFFSGQIPLDPASGEVVAGTIVEQTHQVLKNLSAVIAASGCSWQQVVKTTIYLTDLADFAQVNEIYGSYLSEPYPARATVQVAALPKGVQVEIDAIACIS